MREPHDLAGLDPTGSAVLHGRPTILELLAAAREFLADEVFPATEGAVQYHVRVTLRILDTVVRELELGPLQVQRHTELLGRLGYRSEQELAEAIQAGLHDTDVAALAAALEPTVRAKLEVANPSYLE